MGDPAALKEDVDDALRWCAAGLTYVSEDFSKVKPRSSRARTTCPLAARRCHVSDENIPIVEKGAPLAGTRM